MEKLTKICLGDFLGDFLLSLGDFLTKTSGHPVLFIGLYVCKNPSFFTWF
jgi:hypothetical protein